MKKTTVNKNERLFQPVFPLMALLMTVIVLVLVGQGQAESDTLWHIKAGKWILENGIPYTDPFSWTMRGQDWFAHEWLWETSAALVFESFGPIGLWLFTCLWITIFCGLLWVLLRRYCSLLWATLIYSFVTLSSFIYWSARPHPMAQALFALTIYILLTCRYKPGLLILLSPIILVWSNMHGSAPVGVMLILFYWIITNNRINIRIPGVTVDKLAPQISRWLAIIAAASFFCSVINPHSLNIWFYMWEVSRDSMMTSFIDEWQSPNFQDVAFWPLAIMTLTIIFLLIIKREKSIPFFEILLACGFLFLALQQKRHAPYFYFTSALVIGVLMGHGHSKMVKISARLKVVICIIALSALIAMAVSKPPTWFDDDKYFPISAVRHIQEHGYTNRLFNQYNFGGYLIWENISPFIDGRADMYAMGSDIFEDYLLLTIGGTGNGTPANHIPQYYLDKYGIETILIQTGSRLDLYLMNSPGWKQTFRDAQAVVYRRAGVEPKLPQ